MTDRAFEDEVPTLPSVLSQSVDGHDVFKKDSMSCSGHSSALSNHMLDSREDRSQECDPPLLHSLHKRVYHPIHPHVSHALADGNRHGNSKAASRVSLGETISSPGAKSRCIQITLLRLGDRTLPYPSQRITGRRRSRIYML